MKIRKGDKVKVTTGKYKGTIALVTEVFPKEDKVIVEGVNVKKRAVKKTESSKENFVYIQHPIHSSNVRLVDEDGKYIKNREVKKISPVKKKEKTSEAKVKSKKSKSVSSSK